MGRTMYYKVGKHPVIISEKAFDFLVARKTDHRQPFYAIVDKFITDWKLKDIAPIVEENEALRRANEKYRLAVKELDEENKILKVGRQTSLEL